MQSLVCIGVFSPIQGLSGGPGVAAPEGVLSVKGDSRGPLTIGKRKNGARFVVVYLRR